MTGPWVKNRMVCVIWPSRETPLEGTGSSVRLEVLEVFPQTQGRDSVKAPGLKPGLLYFTQAGGQRVDALISPYFWLDFFALNVSLAFCLVSLT